MVYIDPTGNTYVPLEVPEEYRENSKNKDSVWRYDVDWMLQTTAPKPYKPNYVKLLKEATCELASDAWNSTKNFFVDIFTDEDRTDKSMFSYTPETKAKYDEEKIDKWISPGGSIDTDFLNESKKAFGEIKDYGVDKGTDEAAKWVLGKGLEKAMAPVLGSIMKKSGNGLSKTTSKLMLKGNKDIGELGEKIAKEMLKNNEWDDFIYIKNASDNGIDIIAKGPKGQLGFFEVKTSSTGNIGGLSARQNNMSNFVKNVLSNAKDAKGRYKNIDSSTQKAAADLYEEFIENYDGFVDNISGTTIGVDLTTGEIKVSRWDR